MKHLFLFSAFVVLLISCDFCPFDNNKSSSIGGTTNITMNKVGTTFSPWISISGSGYSGSVSAEITSVEGDVTTVAFKATLPENNPILDGIKSKYKDDNGNLDCEGTFKLTDKGILDYNNKDHKPFVLVSYDAQVGDKYTLEMSDGNTITREVVRKSTDDDFLWNGMFIKTLDVEQDSRIPGVEKLVYFTNHKFGLVAVRVVMEDGTSSQVDLYPSAY